MGRVPIRPADDRIPVVLGVDAEPDSRYPDPGDPEPWHGLEAMFAFMGRLRRRLVRATGEPAAFSWFLRMDRQIETVYGSAEWAARRYARQLELLREEGDEVGVHPHVVRLVDGDWLIDHGNPDATRDVVGTSIQAYRSAFGDECRIHRAGDRMLSSEWLAMLERGGVEVDLTVEPGEPGTDTLDHGVRWTGAIPDYSDAPREPYRSTAVPGGGGGVAMIPLTSARVPRSDRRRLAPGALPPGRPFRQLVAWHCDDPREFWEVAAERLEEMDRPYLAFAFRSDIQAHEPEWRRFRAVFGALRRHPLRRRLAFVTPTEAVVRLGV